MEVPKRPFHVWSKDASKQILGSFFDHSLNILIAWGLLAATSIDLPGGNECVWYMINYLVDCFPGILISWALLKLMQTYSYDLLKPGVYNQVRNMTDEQVWGYQVLQWLIIIFVMKLVVLSAVILPLRGVLGGMGDWALTPLAGNPKLQLALVMVILPFVMNVTVFWIQDHILMDGDGLWVKQYEERKALLNTESPHSTV